MNIFIHVRYRIPTTFVHYQVEDLCVQQYNQGLLIQHLQNLSVCYV